MRISDWSSDVCSSDLRQFREATLRSVAPAVRFVSSGGWTRTTNQEPWRHEGAWALGCAPLVCRAGGSCRLFRVHPCLRNTRSEEHTSELQSLMRISYAVFCLKKKNTELTIKIEIL